MPTSTAPSLTALVKSESSDPAKEEPFTNKKNITSTSITDDNRKASFFLCNAFSNDFPNNGCNSSSTTPNANINSSCPITEISKTSTKPDNKATNIIMAQTMMAAADCENGTRNGLNEVTTLKKHGNNGHFIERSASMDDKATFDNSNRRERRRSMVSSHVTELVKLHFSDVETRLFEMFGNKETKTINVKKFLAGLLATGLRSEDPRLCELYENVREVKKKVNEFDDESLVVNYNTFMGIISENLEIVVRAFSHSFIIPEFSSFCDRIDEIYHKCKSNNEGTTAEYIPQLKRVSKDFWAVSLCTVDGQRHSVGDVKKPFTIQSCSKPLTYAIACADVGPEQMHKYIGLEASGRVFNELCLDYKNKPHNPMINSGAIMTAALVKPEYSAADKFDYMFEMYKRLAAGEYLGFNNSVFLSEKECADRNYALAYFMRENKCFPPGAKLQETLEFYFQLCSLEITAESGAVMAATLANGGINPLTGDPVLTCEAVRNTLTLMHSCGMYNYSGQFAFKVGLPAKSGVSGCVLLVVPNTLGICLWSPSLDLNGNSCRAVQFCSELVNLFTFHHFDNLRGNTSSSTKIDPRVTKTESSAQILFDLLFCVAANDISSLRRHALAGTDLESADYDGRTALHVAASEGHADLVEFLLEKCHVNPVPKDRWRRTPVDDARNFGHPMVEQLLVRYSRQRGITVALSSSDGLDHFTRKLSLEEKD